MNLCHRLLSLSLLASTASAQTAASDPQLARNQAARFDGSGAHVQVANHPALRPGPAFTLECRVLDRDTAGRLANMGDGIRGTTNRAYDLSVTSTEVVGWMFFQGSDAVQLTAPKTEGWSHVAMTFDSAAGVAKLIVDGVVVDSETNMVAGPPLAGHTIRASTYPLVFGRNNGFSAWNLDGDLDFVRIWSRALPPEELAELAGVRIVGSTLAAHPGLVDVWNFEGSGASESHAHSGALNGSVSFVEIVAPESSGGSRPLSDITCGGVASAGFEGSSSVAANDLVLVAHAATPGSVGAFYQGRALSVIPFESASRCLVGAPVFRLSTVALDATGAAAHAIDLTQPVAPGAQVLPGMTWQFQLVYLDAAAPSGWDVSRPVEILFEP